jgi:glycosyltransferase involved in cell wall biosynthesis
VKNLHSAKRDLKSETLDKRGSDWLVSIVIPVYNGAFYLAEAIDSALGQTYGNVEVIVINDGSMDDGRTEAVALSYGNRIRYFSQPNGGVASALNRGLKEMRGHFFSWLSHDDLYLPEKIEAEMDFLSNLPSKTICYSDFIARFQDTGRNVNIALKPGTPAQFRTFVTMQNSLHGCTLLIPRTAFEEHGPFREDLKTTQDYECWFRMARTFQFAHLPKPLVVGRQHAGQGSVRMKALALRECNALYSAFVKELSPEELAEGTNRRAGEAYLVLARNFRVRGFLEAAKASKDLARTSGSIWPFAMLRYNLLVIADLAVAPIKSIVRTFAGSARKIIGSS